MQFVAHHPWITLALNLAAGWALLIAAFVAIRWFRGTERPLTPAEIAEFDAFIERRRARTHGTSRADDRPKERAHGS